MDEPAVLVAAILVAGVVGAGAVLIWAAIGRAAAATRDDSFRMRTLQLVDLFAPGVAAATEDPRALIAWQPLAAAARTLCPDEFAALDRAMGSTFPFAADQIQAAHARWTAAWLAWEVAHDAEYKLKAAVIEDEMEQTGPSAIGRARLEAVQREKIDRYQRRYEEYTQVSRALHSLMADGPRGPK